MSILSGFKKIERYIKQSSGYQKISQWTSSQSVEFDDGTNLEDKMKLKANINSPVLTGTPKAPTASAGNNTTQIATTAFVKTAVSDAIAASDAMVIKGTIGTTGTVTSLPTTYSTGWTYRVVTEGTYAGNVCEIGDLIIALKNRSGSGNVNSDWCVAQTNINGAITGIRSGDAYIDYSQSGSVVTITHKDVSRTNTTSKASPANGGTFTAIDSVTSDAKGHITKVNTKEVTLPTFKDLNITPENIGAVPYSIVDDGDFNDMVNPGIYTMRSGKTNAPTSGYYHSLIVLRSDSGEYVQQISVKEGTTDVYVRYGSGGNWGDWVKLMAAGDTAANAAMLGGHTSSWFEEGRWILHKEKIDLNYYTSFGVSPLCLKGNSIEIGQHTDVVVLGVTNTLCWLAGWSYSGLTLSVNVVVASDKEASATVCYMTRG